jgi:hypothetical protein
MAPKNITVLSDSDDAACSGEDLADGPVADASLAIPSRSWSMETAKQRLDLLVSGGCGCRRDHYAPFRARSDLVTHAAAKLLALKQRNKHDQDRAVFQELREQLLSQGALLPSSFNSVATPPSTHLLFTYIGHPICGPGFSGLLSISVPTFRKLVRAVLSGAESYQYDLRFLKGVPGNNDKGLGAQVHSYLEAPQLLVCRFHF